MKTNKHLAKQFLLLPTNKKTHAFAVGLVLSLSGLPLMAGYLVPQAPLHSGTAVAPNIMVILDNSGSMTRDIIPESFVYDNLASTEANYVYPTFANIYGTSMPHTFTSEQ